jgi:hypothetical protein
VKVLAETLSQLSPDHLRETTPFAADITAVQNAIWGLDDYAELLRLISGWIAKFQPCLFGRIAAREGLLSFCVLNEADIARGDEFVRDRIQAARTEWTREAYEGRKSGFVIWVISERIAKAAPSAALSEFAKRLVSLYLLSDASLDEICLEEVFLELPGYRKTTWRWASGVNYFAANADGRWWQDHRIPGGLALSVNSVGHLVKSSLIARSQRQLESEVGGPTDGILPTKIDSLYEALEFAMRTINMASHPVSGPATYLIEAETTTNGNARCPIKLPPNLTGKDCHQYRGYYHTDITLPSSYFSESVQRPPSLSSIALDFTYLWKKGVDNPDHTTMGSGRIIRAIFPRRRKARQTDPENKVARSEPAEVLISSSPRLVAALNSATKK